MFCCHNQEEEVLPEKDIGDDYYLYLDNILSEITKNIDLKLLLDEILFNLQNNY